MDSDSWRTTNFLSSSVPHAALLNTTRVQEAIWQFPNWAQTSIRQIRVLVIPPFETKHVYLYANSDNTFSFRLNYLTSWHLWINRKIFSLANILTGKYNKVLLVVYLGINTKRGRNPSLASFSTLLFQCLESSLSKLYFYAIFMILVELKVFFFVPVWNFIRIYTFACNLRFRSI